MKDSFVRELVHLFRVVVFCAVYVSVGAETQYVHGASLTVGVNAEDNSTTVPRLIGMKYVSATDVLHDHFLNVGRVSFDKGIRTYADSVNAVVYKQGSTPGASQNLGTAVSLSLTLDTSKLPAQ